jgi:hypothetical protein
MSQDFNRQNAETEIREALHCPADWRKVFRLEGEAFFEPLETLWHDLLRENVRGDESNYVGSDFLLLDLSEESDSELRAMQINANMWKDTCRNQFLTAIRRFTEIRYASRKEYAKHLPPPGPPRTARWIEKESKKRRASLFYYDIPEDEMLTAFLHGIWWSFSGGEDFLGLPPAEKTLWDKLMNDDNSRIAFRCSGPIGASDGVATDIICFELGATTPVVHGYPITEDEALRIHNGFPTFIIDELRDWQLR